MKNTANKMGFEKNRVVSIKLSDIRVNSAQPRERFDNAAIERLAQSIAQNGLLQPLSVRRDGKIYELIAGERRMRALRSLGYDSAPCIIVDADGQKSAVLAIIENIQREDLNVFEQAQGIERLIDRWGVTQSEAAERLGLSQSAVANKLRLLRLSESERRIITEKGLSERHARALLRISDVEKRRRALSYITSHSLNVSQSEKYVEKLLATSDRGGTRLVFKDLRIFVNTINKAVETMRSSGVMASAARGETESYIEYTIRIPKPVAVQK